MDKIIIDKINDKIGPGDIVGALINETAVKASEIGNIDIHDTYAVVEIKNDKVSDVVQLMDGNNISGYRVEVEIYEENNLNQKQKIVNYLNKYKQLVHLEREEEMRRHEKEIKYLSGKQREKKGRAFLRMKGRSHGVGLGNKFIVKFLKQKPGKKLPENEINTGDLVMISKNNPLDDRNPNGTVIEKSNYSITVVFDNKPAKFVFNKNIRIDLYVNDITYQRMLESLNELKNTDDQRVKELRDILVGNQKVSFGNFDKKVSFLNKKLNNSQKKAVKKALAAEDIFLIHGPPGTGKTITCIEILYQYLNKEFEILATADSNTAVDNIVERLVEYNINVIRIGHPARVNPVLREHTLDYMLQENEIYKKAQKFREEAFSLKNEQDQYTHPSGRWRRGMSNKKIMKLAQQNRGHRGVPSHKINEMAEWLLLQDKIDKYFKKVNKLENEAVNQLITQADIICSTNSSAGSEILENKEFDILVIDESTQATEPSSLIPLIKAKKVVMAGDHKQLPPTILNEEAKMKGLNESLFERILDIHGKDIKILLKKQYRMNQNIMNFPSKEFYSDKLIAADKVKNWTLNNLEYKFNFKNDFLNNIFSPDIPVVFLDTFNKNSKELSKGDSNSYCNKIEGDLSIRMVNKLSEKGLGYRDLAVISPYKDQVEFIKKRIENNNIEVDTVDGFQGREKEIIILSLVRSNKKNNIGFLKDLRRLNVSITRAKKKLIIIGDSNTIKTNQTYANLIEYVKENDGYFVV